MRLRKDRAGIRMGTGGEQDLGKNALVYSKQMSFSISGKELVPVLLMYSNASASLAKPAALQAFACACTSQLYSEVHLYINLHHLRALPCCLSSMFRGTIKEGLANPSS